MSIVNRIKYRKKKAVSRERYTLMIVPPTADNKWFINECDTSLKFFELQEASVKYIKEKKEVHLMSQCMNLCE